MLSTSQLNSETSVRFSIIEIMSTSQFHLKLAHATQTENEVLIAPAQPTKLHAGTRDYTKERNIKYWHITGRYVR